MELDGRYRVGAKLGEGAMGTVYEATPLVGGDDVAIKVLHRRFARDEEATRRFAREARAAADVGHPAVVDVLGSGTHQGMPYLVMTRLRGETLAQRLTRVKRLPPMEACEIVGHVLSALASAHAKGIIHRDMKPDNVFLEGPEEAAQVRLLDFGISKFRPPFAILGHSTLEGVIMGTPGYMAPEQWMGRRDIDHRADLFAVGAILYELLCGKVPYGGKNQSEFFLEVVRGTLPPEPPRGGAPDVEVELERTVLRALERDRDRRFSSASEFLDALRPFGAGSIVAVSLPPAPVPLDEPRTRPSPSPRPIRGRDPYRYWLVPMLAGALVSFVVTIAIWRPPSSPSLTPTQRPHRVEVSREQEEPRVSGEALVDSASSDEGPMDSVAPDHDGGPSQSADAKQPVARGVNRPWATSGRVGPPIQPRRPVLSGVQALPIARNF